MASVAQMATNRLDAQEGAGPRTPRGKPAMRWNRLRRPPMELDTASASGRIPRKIVHWDSRPDLSNEISGRDFGREPIPCSREPL